MNAQPEETTVVATHDAEILWEVILVRAIQDILEMVEVAEVNKTISKKILFIFKLYKRFY